MPYALVSLNSLIFNIMNITFNTGRNYGSAQVLTIDVPAAPADALADVDVSFSDAARNISGIVTLMGFELDRNVGPSVLREYDAGRYRAAI